MTWQIALVLFVTIPVLLVPVIFVWYLTLGGIYSNIKEARARRAVLKKAATAESHAVATASEQEE